jgi:hypothetical protein
MGKRRRKPSGDSIVTGSRIRATITWRDALVVVLVMGYLSMTRSFAHVGYSPVYVGEVSLLALLLARSGGIAGRWLSAMFCPSLLSGVAWCAFFSVGYGLMQCLRGIAYGYGSTAVMQSFVFHLYPFFLFAGFEAGMRHAELLPRLIRALAWWHGIYGVVYILVLGQYQTGEDILTGGVCWFGQPHGAGVCLLGLVAFEKDLRRVSLPLLLNTVVLLGMQMRAVWVALTVSLLVWGCLAGRFGQLVRLAAVVGVLFLVAALADIRYPAPASRGGSISARDIVGRALASVSEEAAESIMENPDEAMTFHGNVNWRTEWWGAIWGMVHKTPTQASFGPGYGFAIWSLHPSDLIRDPIRTPHNSSFFALGYTGWLGLTLFLALQLALARLLWRVYLRTGQAFGLSLWVMAAVWACFDGFFETPFSAIPFYLLVGLASAPLLSTASTEDRRGEDPAGSFSADSENGRTDP